MSPFPFYPNVLRALRHVGQHTEHSHTGTACVSSLPGPGVGNFFLGKGQIANILALQTNDNTMIDL